MNIKWFLALAGAGAAFLYFTDRSSPVAQDKTLRGRLSEQQVDNMIADSFPASDPPSTY